MREVKRLDSISRSPVYTSIGEALNGLPTIRAFHAEPRLTAHNAQLVDNSAVMSLVNQSMNRCVLSGSAQGLLVCSGMISRVGCAVSVRASVSATSDVTEQFHPTAHGEWDASILQGLIASLYEEFKRPSCGRRWLSVRLECAGALAAFAAAVLTVEQRGNASTFGLVLSYALQITMLTSITVLTPTCQAQIWDSGLLFMNDEMHCRSSSCM